MLKPISIIRETNNIYKPGKNELSSLRHGILTENVASIKVEFLEFHDEQKTIKSLISKNFSEKTFGYIDLSARDYNI